MCATATTAYVMIQNRGGEGECDKCSMSSMNLVDICFYKA